MVRGSVRTVRGFALVVLLALLAIPLVAACTGDAPLDTIADTSLNPSVWRADGEKVRAVLPVAVGTFKPSEGADAFSTSYGTGPVFGAACTYADGPRQLVLHVESGNIRERAAKAERGHANQGESFVTRDVVVHGKRAVLHWNAVGRTADVVFVVQRRMLLQIRLVPAQTDDEVVKLADAMDLAPFEGLVFDGVTR
jgi:hypothetical protein